MGNATAVGVVILALVLPAAGVEAQRPPKPKPTYANVPYGDHYQNVFDLWLADSEEPTPLALFMLFMQFLYYAAEGVLMVYIVVKGSEAVQTWRPRCPAWLAGLAGGLLLGLTWGLPHILTKGSLAIGLAGLVQSLLLKSSPLAPIVYRASWHRQLEASDGFCAKLLAGIRRLHCFGRLPNCLACAGRR